MGTCSSINGSTRLVGLIGSPVARSSSPEIHNAVFSELGCNYAYVACNVSDDDLERAVRGMEALGFIGYNVTAPYKKRIVPYLDEISYAAELMGAVNTVAIQGGRSLGDNIDGAAFMRTLVMEGINIREKQITVLGGGGAASAVIVQAALDGVARIEVFNRDDEYLSGARELVERVNESTSCEAVLHDLADGDLLRASIESSALLVNATNVGTHDMPGCLVSEDMLVPGLIVADMVYVPRETELISLARSKGNQVVDGVGMFIQQAAISERLWFGIDMPISYVSERFFS